MKIKDYFMDKIPSIIVYTIGYIVIEMMLRVLKVDVSLMIAVSVVSFIVGAVLIMYDYLRKRRFYNELLHNIDGLDKKYLVTEMLSKPDFYEGRLFYQALYEIDKSMAENVNEYRRNITDFKEYVEMWIHEVKIPIASLTLLIHNKGDAGDKRYVRQIRKVDNYIDQILYYVRGENAEKDYLIKEICLMEVIRDTALRNKDDLLQNNIDLQVVAGDEKVYTDSKWLEFILNQIMNNSIKYKKENADSYIKIEVSAENERTKLTVSDNGIGIPKADIPKIFEKSFTGKNGRLMAKSTGMGLYIAKKMCRKLGHGIYAESEEGRYTKITIEFADNDFYRIKD